MRNYYEELKPLISVYYGFYRLNHVNHNGLNKTPYLYVHENHKLSLSKKVYEFQSELDQSEFISSIEPSDLVKNYILGKVSKTEFTKVINKNLINYFEEQVNDAWETYVAEVTSFEEECYG